MTRGARQSAEVKEALRLVREEGLTRYQAAKITGVTQGRLSQILKGEKDAKLVPAAKTARAVR